jgi:DNA mismatch repair protein MSH5
MAKHRHSLVIYFNKGILNKTKTPMGRLKLKQWFLCPLQSKIQIEKRQEIVQIFIQPEHIKLRTEIQAHLKKFVNVQTLLRSIKAKSVVQDWINLFNFFEHSVIISNLLQKFGDDVEFFNQFGSLDIFKLLLRELRAIDFKESLEEGRIVIKQNVCGVLDHMKKVYHGLDELLVLKT